MCMMLKLIMINIEIVSELMEIRRQGKRTNGGTRLDQRKK